MFKGVFQIALMITAVAVSAVGEAALSVWAINWPHESESSRMASSEYGTLNAWHKCIAKGWQKTGSTARNIHTNCIFSAASFQPDAVVISDLNTAGQTQCTHSNSPLERSISGTITNTSSKTYVAYVSIEGTYGQTTTNVRGAKSLNLWLAPSESRTSCLLTLKFGTTQEAAAYDKTPHRLKVQPTYTRGVAAL